MKHLSCSTYDAYSNLPVDNVDWCQIELAYRNGLKALEKAAIENGISMEFIRNKANQEGWPQPARRASR
jgi:hypothetical protein